MSKEEEENIERIIRNMLQKRTTDSISCYYFVPLISHSRSLLTVYLSLISFLVPPLMLNNPLLIHS